MSSILFELTIQMLKPNIIITSPKNESIHISKENTFPTTALAGK